MAYNYTPLTDAEVERWADTFSQDTVLTRCAKDLIEARRLLRAVEWGPHWRSDRCCPCCGNHLSDLGHKTWCDLGRYLAACEGKEQP